MKPQLSSDIRAIGANRHRMAEATIYFFDLAPVLRRFGASAMSNPERLRLVCERHVRAIAGSDFVLFYGTGFYLVVTSCSGPAATGLANYINTSLLMLLFGTDSLSPEQDIKMYEAVEPDDLPEAVDFPLPELIRAPAVNTHSFDANWGTQPERAVPGRDALGELARDGVHVEQGVELSFFPVHDLRRRAVSALFCAPTFAGAIFGHQAFQDLNQAELPYIDRAMLLHSVAFARRLAEAGIVVAIGAPVSFETLAWSKSREIYQRALRGAKVVEQPQLILKIEDIPVGTPADRIAQIVSAVRPFARHIFVHLPNDHIELAMTGRMGASGLVLSLQRRAPIPEVLADSKWLSRAAVSQNAMSCIDHVETEEALAVVRAAGIRFAVGHVFGVDTLRGTAPAEEVRETLARIESAAAQHMGAPA